jgi:RNA polymerase sigma-70 factor (ECF subfamily)
MTEPYKEARVRRKTGGAADAANQEGTDAEIESLAAQAAGGERGALESLCSQIARRVLARVRFLHKGEDAEDIAQNALMRVCASIHTLKDPQAFRAWMHSIVTNEVRGHQRRGGKYGHVVYLDEAALDLVDDDEASRPHEGVLRAEEARAIMTIIDAFPQRQREAVLLHYYDGMSVTEAARVMGLAQPNVSRSLALAREKIHKELLRRKKQTGGARSGMLALMPAGELMRQAIENMHGQFAPADGLWAEEATARALERTAAKGSAEAAASGTKTGSVMKLIGCIAAAAATLGLAGMMLFTGPAKDVGFTPVDGVITFSGVSEQHTCLNPTGVSVQAQSGSGEMMTALRWQITQGGRSAALYSGEGDGAGTALAGMTARGEDGAYILSFFMQDREGNSGWLKKEFTIET